MTSPSPSGVAPFEPDEPFDEDAYDAFIAAMDELIAEPDELDEAFNPNQSRYPKGYKGPPGKAGQWRPKLTTGRGRVAPGHLARDLAGLRDLVNEWNKPEIVNVPSSVTDEVGSQIEKIALRYSARKHYEKRLEEVRAERRAIQDPKWDAWEKFFHDPATTPEMVQETDPADFLTTEESVKLRAGFEEEARLLRERDHADIDAMLGVLREIRPMGGKLRQPKAAYYAVDVGSGISRQYVEKQIMSGEHEPERKAMERDLNKSLQQVLKVIPKAWLDDINSKGEVSWLFSSQRAYASTTAEATGAADEWKDVREKFDSLGEQGFQFLGTHRGYPQVLLFRRPDDDVIGLRKDGTLLSGVGDFENTPLVLDDKGEWSLPQHAVRPSAARLKEFVAPMRNLPPPRQERSKTSAMGPDWDAYKEMRDAVEQREQQGWKFVGTRGPWATLRKDGEEVSLNWAGDPLTQQVGPPDKRDLPPLNPYGQVPLPPLPSVTNTLIRVDPRERSTVLHEISHRLETVYGSENNAGLRPIETATSSFVRRRAGDEKPQKLKDLYPDYAYDEHEMARPDKFVDAYIGKLYSGNTTEVLTMGMEMLWFPRYGSSRDINRDPEMRRLILGLLATL
jgi:hypothetical protein